LLDSAITLIGDEDFYYRGESVLALAERSSFKETISLLWEIPESNQEWSDEFLRDLIEKCLVQTAVGQTPIEKFLAVLLVLNERDVKAFGFTPETSVRAGGAMLDGFLRIVTGLWRPGLVAEGLVEHWAIDVTYRDLIDAALTLVADHELNMSSFVARCTASAGSSPYASVAAATYTFIGRRHGGNTERIKGMLGEADGQGSLYAVIASRIRRGESVPGFGHRLYDIDPRARFLLNRLPDQHGYIKEALKASEELLNGNYPTVDLALLLLEKELNLPGGAGVHLFYMGRLAGWVAHIIEQYTQGQRIRPRARYVGINPTI
jgi:citrate synthase